MIEAVEAWVESGTGENRGRLGEIALRVAVISASANQDTQVTPECLKSALCLAAWQEEVRKVYQPSVARNEQALLGELAITALEALDDKTPGAWVSWRQLYKSKNWGRQFSAESVNRVLRSLIEAEEVIAMLDSKDKPTGKIKINRK